MPAPNNRKCQVETCDRKHHANNYCEKHNRQVKQHGHILTGDYLSEQGKRANAARKRMAGWKWAKIESNQLERANFYYRCKQKVLARDNYICQICFKDSSKLHIDHIKPWAKFPELRFKLNNLRTVCRPCHYYITYKRRMPQNSSWGLSYRRKIA